MLDGRLDDAIDEELLALLLLLLHLRAAASAALAAEARMMIPVSLPLFPCGKERE